jgi:hypothetical protein
VRPYRSKDMSVHVSTCTGYVFNLLTPIVCMLWRCKTCVFLRLVAEMSDRFLEQ